MNLKVWPQKDPRDKVTATFKYTNVLEQGETIASAAVSVSVKKGVDASAAAFLNGASQISGDYVLQGLQGGLDGNVYVVTCVATMSTGRVITLAGVVPVKTIF